MKTRKNGSLIQVRSSARSEPLSHAPLPAPLIGARAPSEARSYALLGRIRCVLQLAGCARHGGRERRQPRDGLPRRLRHGHQRRHVCPVWRHRVMRLRRVAPRSATRRPAWSSRTRRGWTTGTACASLGTSLLDSVVLFDSCESWRQPHISWKLFASRMR